MTELVAGRRQRRRIETPVGKTEMPPRVARRRLDPLRFLVRLTAAAVLGGACTPASPAIGSGSALSTTPAAAISATIRPTASPVITTSPMSTSTPEVSTPTRRLASSPTPGSLNAHNWRLWPEIPTISDSGREILLTGQRMGANPHAFSVVGDCQSMPPVFLGIYDSPGRYRLGESDAYLQEAIDFFHGSFSRQAITVQNGISAASVFSPLWSDPERCNPAETPLQCELRLDHPSVIFVNLGMNWPEGNVPGHTDLIRRIVEYSIEHGVLPVLATQPDTSGERDLINEGIAQVAADYGLPLWNSWRAVQYLPGHGLDQQRGGGYLTVEAWDARNFSALQVLHVLQIELQGLPPLSE